MFLISSYAINFDMNNLIEKACLHVGGLTALSNAIGISPAYAWQLKVGMRPLKPAHCVAIERATGGAVTRKDLRPHDWKDIWPELEGKEK